MLIPAELCALPAIDAGPVCLQPQGREMTGDEVAFTVQIRHPKTVEDILGSQLQHDRTTDRNVYFISRNYLLAREWIRITNFPPSRVSSHLNRQGPCSRKR